MNLKLVGETAIVLGGAKGIGAAVAGAFAREQANVLLADLDPAVETTAVQLAGEHGVETLGVVLDATVAEHVNELASMSIQTFGRNDHVVYAVGAGSGKFGYPFWNLTPEDWPRVLEINLFGAVNAAHAFAPSLREQGHGTLLFLSSIAGQMGSQTDPPYSAAKAALINFMQVVAKDLAPYGVRANAISPGMVKTAVNQSVWQAWHNQQPDEKKVPYDVWAANKIQQSVPLGRWQDAEDVASAAVFLASDLSRNMTGQTLNVDGGQIMHS